MYQRGGTYAEEAKVKVAEVLLPRQDPRTGAWMPGGDEGRAGPVYATALAILSLSVMEDLLKNNQR